VPAGASTWRRWREQQGWRHCMQGSSPAWPCSKLSEALECCFFSWPHCRALGEPRKPGADMDAATVARQTGATATAQMPIGAALQQTATHSTRCATAQPSAWKKPQQRRRLAPQLLLRQVPGAGSSSNGRKACLPPAWSL
jgi:hypothetical protein